MHMIYLHLKRKRRTRWLFDAPMLPVADPSALPRRIFLFWDKGSMPRQSPVRPASTVGGG